MLFGLCRSFGASLKKIIIRNDLSFLLVRVKSLPIDYFLIDAVVVEMKIKSRHTSQSHFLILCFSLSDKCRCCVFYNNRLQHQN